MSRTDITPDDIEAVVNVPKSKRLCVGPYLEKPEDASAVYIGTRYAVGVSSGTAGLHSVIRAAKIGPNDEVVTTLSVLSPLQIALYEGARPVFVDIDENSMNLDLAHCPAPLPRTHARFWRIFSVSLAPWTRSLR